MAKSKATDNQQEDTSDDEGFEDLDAYLSILDKPQRGARNLSDSKVPINEFGTPGMWSRWEKAMYMEGRVHQTLEALASHTVVFDLTAGKLRDADGNETDKTDDASCRYCRMIAKRFDLLGALRIVHKHKNAHGMGVLYPVYERSQLANGLYKYGDLKKLKVLDPTKVRIIRDTYTDLWDLYQYFPKVPEKIKLMGKPEARPDYTGRIVGFMFDLGLEAFQTLQDKDGNEIAPDRLMRMNQDEDEVSIDFGKVWYYDDELIIFFREASDMYPDGISLLRVNYTLLENRLSIDKLAVMAYAKSILPTWVVRLSEGLKGMKRSVRRELQRARTNPGSDIILTGDKDQTNIDRTIADGLSSFGFLLDYFEKQYLASMGVFDTMFTSVGANRATAYIQSYLFDKSIQPDRLDIQRTINKRFFEPLLKRHLKLTDTPLEPQEGETEVVGPPETTYALPKWDWRALVGDDALDIAAALNPWQDSMAQNQIDNFMEKVMKFPAREGETLGATKITAGKDALAQVRINAPVQATAPQATVQTPPVKNPIAPPAKVAQQADVIRTLDERRKREGLKRLAKGGHLIPIPDNYVLYDPDAEI